MDTLNAKPWLLKKANLSLVRRAVMARGTATRAEIAQETKISSTTVRTLLAELMEAGEIESTGYDESGGGRRAERYRFRPDRYCGAAFCIKDGAVHALLVDACGAVMETGLLEAPGGDFLASITAFIDGLPAARELRSIGVGVPGVVEGGAYWRKDRESGEFHKCAIGEALSQRYGIPVVLENDVNATAIGFGRCYGREFPGENPEDTNMAYLHFEQGCVSAGFIAGGRVLRGAHNFAGELGLVPVEGDKLLDERMLEGMDDGAFINTFVQVVGWVCGVLNPQYVALGGPDFRKECIGPIGDGLSALLPSPMSAELLYAPDVLHDYYDGMAHLTAERIFDEFQFIRR